MQVEDVLKALEANKKELQRQAEKNEKEFKKIDKYFKLFFSNMLTKC